MKKKNLLYIGIIFYLLFVLNLFTDAQTPSDMDNFILQKMKDNHTPGLAFSIIRDGKIALSKGYGYANIEKDIPFTPNTINSEIASLSKTVTSTAIMKLWEQGLFQLDDPINNYLPFAVTNPFYPNTAITFRMVLFHTASLAVDNYDLSTFLYVTPGSADPLQVFLQNYFVPGGSLYIDSISYFHEPPGTQYHYSNFGYALLGYLVQRISGMPFDQYCNQNIFQPLCMNNTSWYFTGIDTNIVSRPYYFSTGSIKQVEYGFYERLDYPAGQLKSTAADLSKFLLMHMNYGVLDGIRILKSSTVAMIRTIGFTLHDATDYKFSIGLGWDYFKVYHNPQGLPDNSELWGQDGGDYGVTTNMYHLTTENTGVIILTNGENLDHSIIFYLFNNTSAISTSSLSTLNCSYISNPCEHNTMYWKNNSSLWALNSLPMKLGTKHFYTRNQVLDVLNLPLNGDASSVLAQALITAKLNAAQGSELSPIILTINAAMKLMGDKRIPFDVPISYSSAQGVQMLALTAKLASYNAGLLNTTGCQGNPSNIANKTSKEVENSTAYSLIALPNPVANSTILLFSLSQPEKVSIKIFDLSGRLIKTLANNEFQQGTHQIRWDAKNANGNAVSSGIYLVLLTTGSHSETKKIAVIK